MLKAVGIDHRVTAAYKPSTNGAAEKANQVIIQALRKSTYENPYDWPKWIPFVLLAYRTKVHETTKYTPFELMFGRKVNKFEEWSSEANDDEVEQINNRAKQIKHLVKQTQVLALTNIKKAQETQKRDQNNANKTVCEILPKGSKVYIKNENKVKKKLDPRYSGPFRVLEYTKENNYIVENLQHERVPGQFPIQRIKPVEIARKENTERNLGIECQIEKILDKRIKQDGQEYLVKWKHFHNKHNEWLKV